MCQAQIVSSVTDVCKKSYKKVPTIGDEDHKKSLSDCYKHALLGRASTLFQRLLAQRLNILMYIHDYV